MTAKPALILIVFAQIFGAGSFQAQSPNVIGNWKVEVTFGNGESRSFRFEAGESGKGSFLLLDPRLKFWGPAKPSEAKWTQSREGSVTFSGPVEFPLGNVGRDAGTLMLTGKLGTEDSIMGESQILSPRSGPQRPQSQPVKERQVQSDSCHGLMIVQNPPSAVATRQRPKQ